MPRPATGKKRYGLRKDSGEWLTADKFLPLVGVTTTDAEKRRGWAHDSTARALLRARPEYKQAGFKVRPLDD